MQNYSACISPQTPWILNYQEDLDWWHSVLNRALVWSVTFKAFEIKSMGDIERGLKSKEGRMVIY